MGRKSTKENKKLYQIVREDRGLTREKASEIMDTLSAEKIEKIENDKVNVSPEDVIEMAKSYKAPQLCNYYCSEECKIGAVNKVPKIEEKDLALITVETITSLNRLAGVKDRLLEISEDQKITLDEYEDFIKIKKNLEKIALSVHTLQLWVDQKIAEGEIDKIVQEG